LKKDKSDYAKSNDKNIRKIFKGIATYGWVKAEMVSNICRMGVATAAAWETSHEQCLQEGCYRY